MDAVLCAIICVVPDVLQAEKPQGLDLHTKPQGAGTTSHLGSTTRQTRSKLDGDEEMSEDDQLPVGVVNGDKPRLPPPPVAEHLVSTMGLSTHRMQVMKASFFGAEETVSFPLTAASRSRHTVSARVPSRHSSFHQTLRDGLSPNLLRKDSSLQSQPTLLPTYIDSRADANADRSYLDHSELSSSMYQDGLPAPPQGLNQSTVSAMQAQSALIAGRKDLRSLVAQDKSLVQGNSRLIADAGLFLGRSFRVGWGPNWTLAHSGTSIAPVQSSPGEELHHQPLFSPMAVGEGRAVVGPLSADSHPLRVVLERVDVSHALSPGMSGDRKDIVSRLPCYPCEHTSDIPVVTIRYKLL